MPCDRPQWPDLLQPRLWKPRVVAWVSRSKEKGLIPSDRWPHREKAPRINKEREEEEPGPLPGGPPKIWGAGERPH